MLSGFPTTRALASKIRFADHSKLVYYTTPSSVVVVKEQIKMRFSSEIVINASPKDIFWKYHDVNSWKEWDHDVKDANIFGEFKEGSTGVLIPVNGPKAKFEITEVTKNKSFTSQSKLPLCLMEFSHYLEVIGTDTRVTHSVSFKGVTSFLFGRLIGGQIKKSLPQTLKNLKEACE